jgi:hypothetical protein
LSQALRLLAGKKLGPKDVLFFSGLGAKVPLSSQAFGVVIAPRLADFARLSGDEGANHGIVTDIQRPAN